MRAAARPAGLADLGTLEALYRGLEEEMAGLHKMWAIADGLDEPVGDAFAAAIEDEDSLALLGTIDDYPFGFLLGRSETLLAQADGERVASVRLIFVDHPAREVAVGEAMLNLFLDHYRSRGFTKFDAHVLPGHRLAKNFFEAGGFSARSIVMFHDDQRR